MKFETCYVFLFLGAMIYPAFGGKRQEEIKRLTEENTQLSADNTDLTIQVHNLQDELKKLNESIYTNECDNVECLNGGVCHDEFNRYRCDCPDGWGGDLCETNEATIYAQFKCTGDKTFEMGDKVVFDLKIANAGNAMNTETGVFEAPIDGLYFFSTTLCLNSANINSAFFIMQMDVGAAKATNLAKGQVGNKYLAHCSGTSAVAYLGKGAQAWVEYGYNSNTKNSEPLTVSTTHTFTGFLVNTRNLVSKNP